jgi:hypothetical protein
MDGFIYYWHEDGTNERYPTYRANGKGYRALATYCQPHQEPE